MPEPAAEPKTRRRWRPRLALSVRALMVLVLLIGGWLGWQVRRAAVQRRAVARVMKAHGVITYAYSYPGGFGGDRVEPWAPEWLRGAMGEEYFREVQGVTLRFSGDQDEPPGTREGLPEPETVTRARLAPIEAFDRLETLQIVDGRLTDDALACLERLPRLREIELYIDTLSDAGLAHLRRLTRLRKLVVQENTYVPPEPVSPEGTRLDDKSLASPDDGRLTPRESARRRWLNLHRHDHLSDAGLASLSDMVELQELALVAPGVTDAGLAHLAGLTEMRTLHLIETGITGTGLVHLKGMTRLADLKLLDDPIDDAGLAHLPNLPDLRTLYLQSTEITDAGVGHLAGLGTLDCLSLEYNKKVEGPGLARLKGLKNLRTLLISRTGVRGPGLAHLSGLTGLTGLWLVHNEIADDDLASLEGLSNLQILDLKGNPITDAGLVHLKGLTRLWSLELVRTKVSAAGAAALMAANPRLSARSGPGGPPPPIGATAPVPPPIASPSEVSLE